MNLDHETKDRLFKKVERFAKQSALCNKLINPKTKPKEYKGSEEQYNRLFLNNDPNILTQNYIDQALRHDLSPSEILKALDALQEKDEFVNCLRRYVDTSGGYILRNNICFMRMVEKIVTRTLTRKEYLQESKRLRSL